VDVDVDVCVEVWVWAAVIVSKGDVKVVNG